MRFDVAVAGAGPAGSAAALVLARTGRRVLLVDASEFPRDKVCGDLVGTDAVRALASLGLGHVLQGAHALRAAYLHAPSGRTAGGVASTGTGRGLARVIPRSVLDERLRAAALAAGAQPATGRVKGLVRDSAGMVCGLHTSAGDIAARIVIGAEGYGSCIARALGAGATVRDDSAVVVRAYAEDVRGLESAMHFYVNRSIDGYGWVFPLGQGRANVGLGFITSESGSRVRSVHAAFARFARSTSAAAPHLAGATFSRAAAWPIPFGPASVVASDTGVFLAGDAARLASPLSGSGIHHALRSGALAATCADRALAGDRAAFARYTAGVRRRFEARNHVERFVHRLGGTPERVEPWLAAAALPFAGTFVARAMLALG